MLSASRSARRVVGGSRLLPMLMVLALGTGQPVSAAQYMTWGDYRIDYTSFPSLLIPPEVASSHGITRSEARIVLNISVSKDGKSVAARLDGQVTNLLNQLVKLRFQEVEESTAIYYLASHIVDEKEILKFSIRITPADHEQTYELNFLRHYY